MRIASKWIKSLEDNDTIPERKSTFRKRNQDLTWNLGLSPQAYSGGIISKHKGQYCVRGDLQEGEFETYAPVVALYDSRRQLLRVLGIKFVKDPVANTINLSQKGFINTIIETTGMIDCNAKWTPVTQLCLGSDPDGAPMVE
jgi:hypothetical protein